MKRSGAVLLALYAAALLQLAWYFPQMPERMATHYDGSGAPNGAMTRTFAASFQLGILGILALAFAGLPALLGRLSPRLINIPHRGHWLAPERRAETIAALQSRMAALGCGALLLLLGISELNFRANLHPPPRLPAMPVVACIAGFVAFMAAWTVSLYRRFPSPAKA